MHMEEMRNEVLTIDPKIRHVSVYYNDEIYITIQKNVKSYFSEKETEKSLRQAVIRWSTRVCWAHKIGEPVFLITQYGKIYRITLPFKNGLLLASTELDVDIIKLVDVISKIAKKYELLITNQSNF